MKCYTFGILGPVQRCNIGREGVTRCNGLPVYVTQVTRVTPSERYTLSYTERETLCC